MVVCDWDQGDEMSENNCLFCYGSLQVPEVIKMVTGHDFTGRIARLDDYVMSLMRNAEYPGIIPKTGHSVGGVVYSDLTEKDFNSLDAFEGDQYKRLLVTVDCNNSRLETWAYVVRNSKRGDLTDHPWTLEDFMENRYEQFMTRFVINRKALFELKS